MDENHSIRFSIRCSSKPAIHWETTDSESHNFATCDFERLKEWAARFAAEGFQLEMDFEFRSTQAVRKFMHFWAQYREEFNFMKDEEVKNESAAQSEVVNEQQQA